MSYSRKTYAKNDHLIEQLINDPEYRIDLDGTVWTLRSSINRRKPKDLVWREITELSNCGYRQFRYKRKWLQVHRTIYRKFIGLLDSTLEINHKNGIRNDNSVSNLELISKSENVQHSYDYLRKC